MFVRVQLNRVGAWLLAGLLVPSACGGKVGSSNGTGGIASGGSLAAGGIASGGSLAAGGSLATGGIASGGIDPGTSCSALTLFAADSASLDYGPQRFAWLDDRVRAYNDSDFDATGWVEFDLSDIPDGASIVSMVLLLHHEIAYDNPVGNPTVAIHYSEANNWSRSGAMTADIPRTRLVSGKKSAFNPGDWNDFRIEGTAEDWAPDLADDWLTLGITNLNVSSTYVYAYVYFDGTDVPANRPQLQLEICW